MSNTLPGTTLRVSPTELAEAQSLLSPLFLAGGLMLSQVAQLTGLEPHVIQNWVRRGFVAPPQRKRYTQRQFCRIALIAALKDALQLDKICALLSYVNGHLDDESDDLIDDTCLYLYLCKLAHRVAQTPPAGEETVCAWCTELLEDYAEPVPGARARVERCLQILLTAYLSARLKAQAEGLLAGI